jgi:hypothetical protein
LELNKLAKICLAGMITNILDFHLNRGIEQRFWGRVVPTSFVLVVKFGGCQMARYAGHEHLAITPWRPKVKCKSVVFDVLVASVSLERELVQDWNKLQGNESQFTVWKWPPERCSATALEIEFFSATQRIFSGGIVAVSRVKAGRGFLSYHQGSSHLLGSSGIILSIRSRFGASGGTAIDTKLA